MTIDFNVVDKSTYVITLFWNSTPPQIINEDKKGIPILSVDIGNSNIDFDSLYIASKL